MVEVTRLNGIKFALNDEHIEIMEETPDTVITLVNGHKYVVTERVAEIMKKIQVFRRGYSLPV